MFHYMERRRSSPEEYVVDDEDEYDHFSTGYLQDVFFEFNSKRRRLTDNHTPSSSFEKCWTSNLIQNFNTAQIPSISGEEEEEGEVSETNYYDSSSSQKEWTPEKGNLFCTIDPIFSSPGGRKDNRKKRVVAKVVYPFALVKPGGFEGDATIDDINQRILMPPTRPVRHPVGDFACRPLVSPDGPGLSGKAVVAFTRIHTQGRGTITIIRTKG